MKIVDREKGVKYDEDDEVQNRERIKVDLIARITFIEAKLEIHPLFVKDYEGRKDINHKADIKVKIDDTEFIAAHKGRHHWIFKGINKFELFEKSDDRIIVKIFEGETVVL